MSLLYAVAYLSLDWISSTFLTPLGISLWYPSAALSLVAAVVLGRAAAPLIMLVVLLDNLWIYGFSPAMSLTLSGAHTLAYMLGGLALRRALSDLRLDRVVQAVRFLVVGALTTLASALLACANLAVDGQLSWPGYPEAVLTWWLGDGIGVIGLAPALLVYAVPHFSAHGQRPARGSIPPARLGEAIAQGAAVVATIWLVFFSPLTPEGPLFLCFLPLIWIALRGGTPAAVLAIWIMHGGVVLGALLASATPLSLLNIQLVMLSLALTGLILGAVVSEHWNTAQALRESEARATAIVQEQIDLVCRYRPDTTLTFVNDAYCRFFGRTREALLGQSFLPMSRPEYHELILQQIEAMFTTGAPLYDESLIYRADGELRWMQWLNRTITDGQGVVVEVQVVGRDITERRKAEQAYRSLVEESVQGLAILQRTRLLFVNPAFCAMTGYSHDELLANLNLGRLVAPEDRGLIREVIMAEDERWYGRPLELRVVRKNGQLRWLEIYIRPTTYDDQSVIMVMALDITARREAEAALQRSEERYRSVSELTSDYAYSYRIDEEGVSHLDWLAGAFYAITGYTLDEIAALGGWDTLVLPADLELLNERRRNIAGGMPYEADVRITRRDGELRWLHISVRPERDSETGRVVRAYGAVQDVTERKRAEQDRLAIERKLQEAQKLESIGLLAGGIAHDFNNLLVSVLGNASLALADLTPDMPAYASVRQIEIGANHAADLTRQLLAYAGKGQVRLQRLELNPLINEMIAVLRVSVPSTVTIEAQLAPDLPAIDGDLIQLRQVLMNLVLNAVESIGGAPGLVTVATGLRWADQLDWRDSYPASDLPEGQYVEIKVIDTGCGMDEATIRRIFEPFFTTKPSGRGLGLAAVLGIVRAHHGVLKIRSAPGAGSAFSVLLPDRRTSTARQLALASERAG